ncbi:MAG TPA: Mur ligase family protein [Burkholderiaceae bacterium]|nr:Mur ligase family protein [Burkholderiaceae bacterium]
MAWTPTVVVGDPARRIARVHTDTRTVREGDLFVALRGERFDAHDFLAQARASGATAAIASRGLVQAGLDGLLVADPLVALQALAAAWRRRYAGPLIAVAGSNGKTTVTQMIASVLRAVHGADAHATAGNLNNHIGVPLTVLGLRAHHRAAVVELGMNHPGEIAVLARIAQPTIAVVNNAQREHQEFMASVEAVARENGGAIEALPPDGVAVFPADDAQAATWVAQAGARRCLRFRLRAVAASAAPVARLAGAANGSADASASAPSRTTTTPLADARNAQARVEVEGAAHWDVGTWRTSLRTPEGSATMALRVAGRHNVHNALAATAAAAAAGIALADIVRGLEDFVPVKGRSLVRFLARQGRTCTLIDDTYNANPDSVRAAIDVLAGLPRPTWLLLGDMGEVGDQGAAFHAEIGAYAAERGVDHFWCAGPLCAHAAAAFGPLARHYASTEALLAALALAPQEEPDFESVLVKGSRFMAMERVVAQVAGDAHAA